MSTSYKNKIRRVIQSIKKSPWFYYPVTPIHIGVYEIASEFNRCERKFSFWDGKRFKSGRYPRGDSTRDDLETAKLAYAMKDSDTNLPVTRWRGIVLPLTFSYYEFENLLQTVSELEAHAQSIEYLAKCLRNI